jgi:hypothetical protein
LPGDGPPVGGYRGVLSRLIRDYQLAGRAGPPGEFLPQTPPKGNSRADRDYVVLRRSKAIPAVDWPVDETKRPGRIDDYSWRLRLYWTNPPVIISGVG